MPYADPMRKVAYLKEWHERHPEARHSYYRKAYEADPEKYRLRGIARRRKLKQDVIAAYGNKCACCGETRIEFLSVDHVNGGGTEHRRSIRSAERGTPYAASYFYYWLKKHGYPQEGFRALCMNCNWAIGAYGSCPHQSEKSRQLMIESFRESMTEAAA